MRKNIKIGAVAWGLPGSGNYAPKTAAAAGLDGLQLELGSYERGYPLAQKEVMEGYEEDRERYQLEYPAIVLNDVMVHEFIHGSGTENGKIAYDQIALAVDVAAKMKIDRIMIPNFLNNLITEENHMENTMDALEYACSEAEKYGIMILTENAMSWERQIYMLEQLNRKNLKIHFDTQNFQYNFRMDQCEVLERLYPYMDEMLHVKDGENEPGDRLLGAGTTNFEGQMRILREKGFAGWIITENYYDLLPARMKNISLDQMELLKKDIETIKKSLF